MKSNSLFLFSKRKEVLGGMFFLLLLTFVNATTIGNMNSRGLNVLVPTSTSCSCSSSGSNSTFNITYDNLIPLVYNYSLVISPSGGSNIFDQNLNTTDWVSFDNITIRNNIYMTTPDESCIWGAFNLSHLCLDEVGGLHVGYHPEGVLSTHTVYTGGTIQELIEGIEIGRWNLTGLFITTNITADYFFGRLLPNSTIISINNVTDFNYNYNQTLTVIINNIFNQDLNTSSSVVFQNISTSQNITITTTSSNALLIENVAGSDILRVDSSSDVLYTPATVRARTNGTADIGQIAIQYRDAFFNGTLQTRGLKLNGTVIDVGLIVNYTLLNIFGYNQTSLDPYSYNFSSIAIPYNSTKLTLLNLTGVDDNACTGTDKVSNVTLKDGSLSITCTADQTGAGGSSTYKEESARYNTTSSDLWIDTGFYYTLGANTNYTLTCMLWVNSNVTTTGVQLNITVPTGVAVFNTAYEHPTTATAVSYTSCHGTVVSCADMSVTSVAYPSSLPVEIYSRIDNINAGLLNLTMKSEVNKSIATINKGSFCELKQAL